MTDPVRDTNTPDFYANLKKFKAPQEAEAESPSLVPFYWEGEHQDLKISWLVPDFFPMRSVNLIVGESQAGKTFIILDLAIAIAAGRSFFGKQVVKGGVLYIAAEGAITIPGRLRAARQGLPDDEKLIAVIHEPPPNLMEDMAVNRIIATAQHINSRMLEASGHPLVLVVIDTMVSSFAINNWNEVGETSKAMKMLGRIMSGTNAAVIGVHHHGKDTSRGAAGSHALTASADAILSVYKRGEDGMVSRRYISLTKSRFGETGRTYDFELQTKPPDEREGDGDDHAFVVPLSDKPPSADRPKDKSPTSHRDHILKLAFESLVETHGIRENHADLGAVRQVNAVLVREKFEKLYQPKGASNPAEAKRKAWRRGIHGLGDGPIQHGEWDGNEWIYIKVDDES